MAEKDEATADYGAHIKSLLEANRVDGKRMTQAALAKKLSLKQGHMNAVLNKNAPLKAKPAGILARLFGRRATEFTADRGAYCENHVAIIFAATKEDWQCQYEWALRQSLLNSIFTFFPLHPKEDFNWAEHRNYQQLLLRNKRYYAGCIVLAPVCTKAQFLALCQFAKAFEKPVVIVDQNPPVDERDMPKNMCCVSFSDEEGGRCAGEEVLRRIQETEKATTDSQALVITGFFEDPNSAKRARGTSFKKVLEKKGIDTEIVPYGEFTESEAAKVTSGRLKQGLKDNKPYVAVFATSGPMTEGVVTAVCEIYRKKSRKDRPLVVGYDETEGTRLLLQRGDVVGIVVQDVEKLADATINHLQLLWRGQKAPKQVDTLKPVFKNAKL